MPKGPAVIIIARHGARLDAADKTWLTTSPTPYDPPLSYGGWTQTRALGARIASLLHARDVSLNEDEVGSRRRGSEPVQMRAAIDADSSRSQKRRHRLVFHSSPFLRCIQSSLAIAAGMAQYEGNLAKFEAQQHLAYRHLKQKQDRPRGPTRAQTLDPKSFDEEYALEQAERDQVIEDDDEEEDRSRTRGMSMDSVFQRPILRIDAFLGEWLSPDYFEFITSPPPSVQMVATAKAELVKQATPIHGAKAQDVMPDVPADWSVNDASGPSKDVEPLSLSSVSSALPASENGTESMSDTRDFGAWTKKQGDSTNSALSFGYVPPTPDYAISLQAPIPRGYTADARDHCVKIGYQWDSMRDPQQWGDGGEHGEEWSSMHRRFRRGLMDMLSWYKEKGAEYDPQRDSPTTNLSVPEGKKNGRVRFEEVEVEDEEELVVVIVTHGAGCNALIGALTNQPVLIDVGMASLTMAVRKARNTGDSNSSAPPARRPSFTPVHRRRSSIDCSQAEEYDVKLVASTEHLRAGADPLAIPQLQSPQLMPSIPENSSGTSEASGQSTPAEVGLGPPAASRPKNSALGSMRRTRALSTLMTSQSPLLGATSSPGSSTPNKVSSPGLWGSNPTNGSNIPTFSLNRSNTSASHYGGMNRSNSTTRRELTGIESHTIGAPGKMDAYEHAIASPPVTPLERTQSKGGLGARVPSNASSNTPSGLWGGGPSTRSEPKRRWTFAEK